MDPNRVRRALDPEYRGPARGRPNEVEEDPDRRGLAGAVRSEEAEDLALIDGQVDADNAPERPIRLRELLGLDDGGHAIPFLRSSRNRLITSGTSCSTKAMTSRNSSRRARASGGRSAVAARPRSAITRIWRYIAAALPSIDSRASGGALKYSRRSPGRVVRRIMPALARRRAVPLIAPRLAWRAAAVDSAVCSDGSQMSSQPHIPPAIGGM